MTGHAARDDDERHVWRSFWRCFALCAVAALVVVLMFRWPIVPVLLVLFLIACPIAGLWAYLASRRPLPVPLGPAPETGGHTLNWLAPWYDELCARIGFGHGFRARTIELAGIRSGDQILDIGCGTGVLTCLAARMAGSAGSVRGIDAAPDMVRIAREKAACVPCRPQFDLAAIEALPFPDAHFDVVLASLVLHHLSRPVQRAGLEEVRRVLKPEGRLIVVEFDRPQSAIMRLLMAPLSVGPNLRRHLRGKTDDILRRAGFVPTRIGRWGRLIGIWSARPVIAARPGTRS